MFIVFSDQLLPNVFKSHAWGILHNLLDMFSYRIHHVQPHYRVTLLSNIHSLAAYPQANQTQLQLWYVCVKIKTEVCTVCRVARAVYLMKTTLVHDL